MSQVNVYSSAPLSTPLAVALLGLEAQGHRVRLRPLSELPSAAPHRRHALRQELEQLSVRLALIGDALTAHEAGERRLGAGDELGLRAERDALLSRQRGIRGSLRGLREGGLGNG